MKRPQSAAFSLRHPSLHRNDKLRCAATGDTRLAALRMRA